MQSTHPELDQRHEPQLGKWWVCGLLLLALMLNYMDRQTLSLTIATIKNELGINEAQYGKLEAGFGYAFAIGGLLAGFLADRISVRWLYPLVLLGWSLAGVATGFADRIGTALAPIAANLNPDFVDPHDPADCAFFGFLVCRVILGLFEAGQWPCALVTTQRLLTSENRPFGNSVLQSGASLGAIFTPLIVQTLVTAEPGTWRQPYVVVGIAGLMWIVPWLWVVRGVNLAPVPRAESDEVATIQSTVSQFPLRFLALIAVVISINLPWHFFRAWLPLLLQDFHKYEPSQVRYFTMAYYISTDVGCIAIGTLTKWLASRGHDVHRTRVFAFTLCAALTALSMLAANQERSPLLLGMLLLIGAGSLGLFPIYYSLSQELSTRHQGKVTGTLSLITWVMTSQMQSRVGQHVKETQSYSSGIFWVGLAPLVGLAALLLLWNLGQRKPEQQAD